MVIIDKLVSVDTHFIYAANKIHSSIVSSQIPVINFENQIANRSFKYRWPDLIMRWKMIALINYIQCL